MSQVFPLDIFPTHLFPDTRLSRVTVDKDALNVSVTDSAWALQSDITLFYGAGDMIFYYDGVVQARWRGIQEEEWRYLADLPVLDSSATLEMIARNEKEWRFRFRSAGKMSIMEFLVPAVTRVEWTGPGERFNPDMEECLR